MSQFLQAAGRFIDGIKINQTARVTRDGRLFWVKRRRNWGKPVAICANAFFRATKNPMCVWTTQSAWREWEVNSFRLLHGEEGYEVFEENGAVWAERIPGEDLAALATQDRLTEAICSAAARELRRAHGLYCPALGSTWSHGDPHLGNFLFDPDTDRARLIDFEVTHCSDLAEDERHAEDLLAFLQDLMGSINTPRWLSGATSFLQCYGSANHGADRVVAALRRKLEVPKGIDRIWWSIRTTYISKAERERRITALRRALGLS